MNSPASSVSACDFYDRFNDRGLVARASASFAGLVLLLIVVVANPGYLQSQHEEFLLVLCWVLLATLALALPRLFANLMQAYRGMPALRFTDDGIWSRRWSQLGWIRWSDIGAVVVVSRPLGKRLQHELRIDLRDGKYAQLLWNDRLGLLFVRLVSRLFAAPMGPRTLWLASSTSLTGSWERLMRTLDPILAARGVSRREAYRAPLKFG